jgi:hypothetical protein
VAYGTHKGKRCWHVGLRVKGDRHLAVTPASYGGEAKHAAAAVRLNAWLAQLH